MRRTDLEEIDTSLIIIDVNSVTNYRLINVYRSFNPPNGKTQKEAFAQQLNLITTAINNNLAREIIVLGDFSILTAFQSQTVGLSASDKRRRG